MEEIALLALPRDADGDSDGDSDTGRERLDKEGVDADETDDPDVRAPMNSPTRGSSLKDTPDLFYPFPKSTTSSTGADLSATSVLDYSGSYFPIQGSDLQHFTAAASFTKDEPSSKSYDYQCLEPGCHYMTKRSYDLKRHVNAKHKSNGELAKESRMYDCPYERCTSKGLHGFKRKDHLRDHVRRCHMHELPNEFAGSGKKYKSPRKPSRSK